MELERPSASASVAPVAALVPPAPVASVTPPVSVTLIAPSAQATSLIPPASVAPTAPLTTVPPTAPLAAGIPPASISATQSDPLGQVGGAKTQKRIEFNEVDCRLAFRKALLCKTFTPQDEDADLNTVLYSFREVIRRELRHIMAEHPSVKAWIGLTNLYD